MLISKNKVNLSAVDDYIKRKGYKLPDDFNQFLRKYNGGNTPNTTLKTSSVSTDVRLFYGVDNDMPNSLNKVQVIDKEGSIYLPIAEDSFGNVFVLDITQNTGVYFVDHEKGRKLEFVTESFDSFVKLCKSEPIKENSKKTPQEREAILIRKGKENNITEDLRKLWQEEYNKYKGMIQEEVVL